LIVQHMPPMFTKNLAQRIQNITGISSTEAKSGEILQGNKIYIAPGDYHMLIEKADDSVFIRLDKGPKRNSVRPSVDSLFESAAKVFPKRCMGMVLTGMGEDGAVGARAIKESGGVVMIQDKDSSVVWGMPGAVYAMGAYDQIGDLHTCARYLKKLSLRIAV